MLNPMNSSKNIESENVQSFLPDFNVPGYEDNYNLWYFLF
jgi:hypothetical protein